MDVLTDHRLLVIQLFKACIRFRGIISNRSILKFQSILPKRDEFVPTLSECLQQLSQLPDDKIEGTIDGHTSWSQFKILMNILAVWFLRSDSDKRRRQAIKLWPVFFSVCCRWNCLTVQRLEALKNVYSKTNNPPH